MLIILTLYLVMVWLVFARLKLVRLNWITGTIATAIGAFIFAVFVALLNSLAPNGRITVVARVIEVTPNVSGEVTAVPVKPNVPVKAGTVLFQIDPTPFRYKVTQLEAALAAAEQNVRILKANYRQQTANVGVLDAQFAYHQKRLNDLQIALRGGAETEFRIQDIQNQFDTTSNQLQAAKAAQLSAKLALDSEIGGVNTTIVQTRAQLGGGPGTKVGVLNCTLGPHLGLIVGGFERMDCRFTPERPGPVEAYSGTMATLGVDLGFTAGGALTWGVFAPTNVMMPGSLAGSYVGASGNVGFAVGVGENFLIGGSGNTVALQPWSVEGTTGVNVSVGLANMELRPAM